MSTGQSEEVGLSLCMIVRDEAEMLPACLAQARGLWDELIVVDTGSQDDTVAIAEAAGARVLRYTWDDDFAAARNAALAAATKPWVLSLDADELISEELRTQVRATIEDASIGAATVTMRNELPHGLVRTAPLLRLFRRDDSVRYEFPIHEDLTSTLQPFLTRTGLRLVALSGSIDHKGYVRERAAGRGKKERDLRILGGCLATDPGDLYSHFKRLELARYWDDLPLWEAAAGDAKRALEESGSGVLQDKHYGGELLVLIARGAFDSNEALSFVEQRRDQVPPSAELHYFCGQLHEEAGRPDLAREQYEACMAVEGVRNQQMATVRPLMGLCRLSMAAGDSQNARAFVDRALDHGARDPEALLAAFTLGWAIDPEEPARFAERHIQAHGTCPELYNAWGQAAMVYGDAPAAEAAFRELSGDPPTGQAALHLGQALVRQGKLREAHEVLSALVPSMPEAGIGVLVCELGLDQDTRLELEIEEDAANQLLREWITTALLGANDQMLRNIAKRVPTIQHVFPWLPEALGLAA